MRFRHLALLVLPVQAELDRQAKAVEYRMPEYADKAGDAPASAEKKREKRNKQ